MSLDSHQFSLVRQNDGHRAWHKIWYLRNEMPFLRNHAYMQRDYITRPPEFRVYGSQQQKLFSEGVTKDCGPGKNTLQTRRSRNSYDDDGKNIHVLL